MAETIVAYNAAAWFSAAPPTPVAARAPGVTDPASGWATLLLAAGVPAGQGQWIEGAATLTDETLIFAPAKLAAAPGIDPARYAITVPLTAIDRATHRAHETGGIVDVTTRWGVLSLYCAAAQDLNKWILTAVDVAKLLPG